MRPYDVIQKKRDGFENTTQEIDYMIEGFVKSTVPDYQMAAWLMSIYFNHMTARERYDLTMAMLNSGDKIDLSEIEGIKIDKHSTGGVGDKTTICLAPMVASMGLKVSKLSGRGLGHTGGTVDKLEAIPGFRSSLSEKEFIDIANKYSVVVAGQTANIAPADKKIYALRDITATVDEVSLISASIMSKKLAVMSDGIVLDVKTGSGAFMKSVHESAELARAMVDIAKLNQKKVVAIVTNMNQPLGETVGNSIEVLEAIQTMKGDGPSDLTELCFELAARMIQISGIDTYQNSKIILEKNIRSGKVAEIAKKWIQAQGGEPKVIDDPESYLNISSDILEFRAQKDGYIFKIDTQAVGVASMVLGAGRAKKEDVIDPSVGIKVVKKLGDYVKKGEVIAYIYKSAASNYEESLNLLEHAYAINKEKPDSDEYKLIYEVIE